VKAIAKRLCRLEEQIVPADRQPRVSSRIVLHRLDRISGLEGATCWRTLLRDGTVSESVVLGRSSNGRAATDEELDRWVETFPIEKQEDGIRLRQLPPL
jgi:hypothetical protein